MGDLILPQFLGSSNTQALFNLSSRARDEGGEIVLDASEVEFVDPLGLAVLGATFEPLLAAGRKVRLEWLRTSVASYLARMGLFERCPFEGIEVGPFVARSQHTNLVELTRISEHPRADEAAHRLAVSITGQFPAWLSSDADEAAKFANPLQYVLAELLENALTHARREGCHGAAVWVAAQYYASRDLVRVAVVDNGCGMLASLSGHPMVRGRSHLAAISAALLPRVSCNRDLGPFNESVNEGVGLTTAYRIALAAGGTMSIISGDGRVVGSNSFNGLRPPGSWPGVAIGFSVRRSRLPEVKVSLLLPTVAAEVPPIRFE